MKIWREVVPNVEVEWSWYSFSSSNDQNLATIVSRFCSKCLLSCVWCGYYPYKTFEPLSCTYILHFVFSMANILLVKISSQMTNEVPNGAYQCILFWIAGMSPTSKPANLAISQRFSTWRIQGCQFFIGGSTCFHVNMFFFNKSHKTLGIWLIHTNSTKGNAVIQKNSWILGHIKGHFAKKPFLFINLF